MKTRYIASKKTTSFEAFGLFVCIEHRIRLNTFDLTFYPNAGLRYGAAQYYNKVVYRDSDFTALCAIIVKAIDEFSDESNTQNFHMILKELILERELNLVAEPPAHSSAVND